MGAQAIGTAIGCCRGRCLDLGSGLGCKALLAVSGPELTQLTGSAGLNNGGGHVLCGVTACLSFLQNHRAQCNQQKRNQQRNQSGKQKLWGRKCTELAAPQGEGRLGWQGPDRKQNALLTEASTSP